VAGRAPRVAPELVEQYRQAMTRYARQPLRKGRVLRYLLLRPLLGDGLFAPYLDRGKWHVEFRESRMSRASPKDES
jgi:hypothetical protein